MVETNFKKDETVKNDRIDKRNDKSAEESKEDIALIDVIKQLRRISYKQKTALEKVAKQETNQFISEQKERFKKERKEKSCLICSDVIISIINHSQQIADDADALKQMFASRTYSIVLKDNLTYSIEDISARIERNKHMIKDDWYRYIECCKLPDKKRFKYVS